MTMWRPLRWLVAAVWLLGCYYSFNIPLQQPASVWWLVKHHNMILLLFNIVFYGIQLAAVYYYSLYVLRQPMRVYLFEALDSSYKTACYFGDGMWWVGWFITIFSIDGYLLYLYAALVPSHFVP